MLLNDSYNNKEQRAEIDALVGKPYTLAERLRMKGIGSPKLIINSCSKEIESLLLLDNNQNCCYIELRPKGIILRFRSLLETFALVVPYYKLTLFKGKSHAYSVHCDHHKIEVAAGSTSAFHFFKKVQQQKAESSKDYL